MANAGHHHMVVSPIGAMATMVQSLCLQLSHCRAFFLKLSHVPTQPAANAPLNRGAGATFVGRLIVV